MAAGVSETLRDMEWIVGEWIVGEWIVGEWIVGEWITGEWILCSIDAQATKPKRFDPSRDATPV